MSDLFGLLNFKAFSPDPLDPGFALQSRIGKNKSLLALNIGATGIYGYQAQLRGSGLEIVSKEKIEAPYLTAGFLEQGKEMTRSKHIVMTFTPASLLCEQESGHIPDDASLQRALLSNPKSILRNRYEQDRRYQLVPSADRRKFISFSVTSREIVGIEKVVREAGMQVVRMQIGLANLTEYAVRRLETAQRDGIKRLIVAGDQSLILGMGIRDGQWEDPFSFISRTSEGSSIDVENVVEYFESLAMEADEPNLEFNIVRSQTCWWFEPIQEWFQKRADRYQLKILGESSPFMELKTALEG